MEQTATSYSTSREVTGSTTLFAIVADPIHHVRLPQMFNELMRQWDKDALLLPVHVVPNALETVVGGLRKIENLAGFAVTVPHKSAVLRLCDEASARAQAIGAVNVVRREPDGRLIGDILDGRGFVDGLRRNGIEPRGTNVFMAGAGGAANAIAFGLADEGIASLAIWNRSRSKSEDLCQRLNRFFPELQVRITTDDPVGAELVVNATSLGLRPGDPPPINLDQLQPHQVVAEIIMKPIMTPLLLAAAARGCRICLGAAMLDCQLAPMAEFMGMHR